MRNDRRSAHDQFALEFDEAIRHEFALGGKSLAAALASVLQRQEVGIQLVHRHLEPSVNRMVFGLMVSALFVGSSVMWAAKAPPLWDEVSVFGALGCSVSAMLGYRLFRAIQHSGKLEERDRPK